MAINSLQHNLGAMNAGRMLGINDKSSAKSIEKLSSGFRINRAADDAAGLAISEKLRRQIRGLNQGAANITDGISLAQVADGALDEVDGLLHRLNVLSVQASNGTLTDIDRGYLQQEAGQICDEINRIGSTTTYNEIHIFDKEEIEAQIGKISNLVESPSAKTGKLSEAYEMAGNFYPSASIDFSNVKSEYIGQLNGGYFSFECPYGCGETFKITLSTDSPSSGPRNSVKSGDLWHEYTIGINGMTSGNQIIDAINDYVKSNPANAGGGSWLSGLGVNGVGVSHGSALIKDGNKLVIASDRAFADKESAAKYMSRLSGSGSVDCSSLTSILVPEPVFTLPIQCSTENSDIELVKTRMMNTESLGLEPFDISFKTGAYMGIDKVKGALACIADLRSNLGATQNRLEHSYNTNLNTAENTQAAESQIRDTDMSKEIIKLSLNNILSQAGTSMLAQANQTPQGVLSLLQG